MTIRYFFKQLVLTCTIVNLLQIMNMKVHKVTCSDLSNVLRTTIPTSTDSMMYSTSVNYRLHHNYVIHLAS